MGSYLDESVERLKGFEGSVPWMYVDTVGKVTVGVGLMLPDVRSAALLPFMVGERAATRVEVEKEFMRVSGLAKGRAAAFYQKRGGLRISEETIDQRLREVLEGFEGYLKAHIAGYEGLPDAAKMGLLDMVYNLGPGRLFREYPKLLAAVERGDWAKAAGASLRHGPSAARNGWTRAQFLEAAQGLAIKAEAAVQGVSWRWVPVLMGAAAVLVMAVGAGRRAVD